MKLNYKTLLLIYLLTIILSSRRCADPLPPPPSSNPVESGYLVLDEFTKDKCWKAVQDQNNLKIKITINVLDNNNNPVLWTHTGVTNPAIYSKADLGFCGAFGATRNCIFHTFPGENKKFNIEVEVIGDCCTSCFPCPTLQVYGKTRFIGGLENQLWEKPPKSNHGYILSIPLRSINLECVYEADNCPL